VSQGEDGFTLIEVLVAFAILSLALVGLYDTLGGAYMVARSSRMQEEALAAGRSQLDRIGGDVPVRTGMLSGLLSDGSPWEVVIIPIRASASREPIYQRYSVVFDARDVTGRSILQLKTIRIAKDAH
jgi:general secretion pathway protein I